MDSYQAIYDAVRSKISNGDIGRAVTEVAREQLDVSWARALAQEQIGIVGYEMSRPSVLFRPDVTIDGNMYSVLYGSNIMEGCVGYGDTLAEAMTDFDKNWHQHKLSETGLQPSPAGDDLKYVLTGQ
ncbi:MAG: hypothetical protein GY847_25225 [Proteobacteria bacterium]|nr:hypothetical protein [Pseudomonadota bacterium]